ncbi:type IX secretion system membrane protein PorP/SprF [Chitinophaga oryzae]|uniref:Type IX secretion system membrane protein PorP/SprF n=1 Tax=Chitinophaga oryzae TaxID=2725414 RepID=A0ABX6LBL2_9BACT|nr:type IX secretion system membrane protein PorP/SprF [Chitinophaga oryzae]
MKSMLSSLTKRLALLLLMTAAGGASAQTLSDAPALLDPSGTQFFQNQYLANAAMAGMDTGLHVNLAYRRQWKQLTGAPETRFLTVDGALGKRVGAGLNVFNDVAGLINRTRVAMSYAYHLPVGARGNNCISDFHWRSTSSGWIFLMLTATRTTLPWAPSTAGTTILKGNTAWPIRQGRSPCRLPCPMSEALLQEIIKW